jgi:hypothetical protein
MKDLRTPKSAVNGVAELDFGEDSRKRSYCVCCEILAKNFSDGQG